MKRIFTSKILKLRMQKSRRRTRRRKFHIEVHLRFQGTLNFQWRKYRSFWSKEEFLKNRKRKKKSVCSRMMNNSNTRM